MRKQRLVVLAAFSITLLTLTFGYLSFGTLVASVFAAGYLGGFFLWFILPANPIPFSALKGPYWFTLGVFVFLHKVEENRFKFFDTVSEITGMPVPSITSVPLAMLLVLGVIPWLFIPYLINRKYSLGYYFSWTLFASMGITELAHFLVFPFLVGGSYRYFPGMISVLLLAPMAWWGMWRLAHRKSNQQFQSS